MNELKTMKYGNYEDILEEKMEEINKQAKVIQWYEKENRLNQSIINDDIKKINDLKKYNEHLAKSIKDYEELLLEKQTIINQTREMLYKRDKDDYDTYTANVICDIQSDFEEILRGE